MLALLARERTQPCPWLWLIALGDGFALLSGWSFAKKAPAAGWAAGAGEGSWFLQVQRAACSVRELRPGCAFSRTGCCEELQVQEHLSTAAPLAALGRGCVAVEVRVTLENKMFCYPESSAHTPALCISLTTWWWGLASSGHPVFIYPLLSLLPVKHLMTPMVSKYDFSRNTSC